MKLPLTLFTTLLLAPLAAPLAALGSASVSMPTAPDNHDAYDLARRIRERLR
jgi:hypothetical protein